MKFNLWATNDGHNFTAPINGGFGNNQFSTIAKAQNAVDDICNCTLEWDAPSDTTQYDSVYGYRIHGTLSPDSRTTHNGITYTITKCEESPPILAEILPTIEAIEYALKKGDVGFCDKALINRLKFLKTGGEYGCPGAYTKDCQYNITGKLLCYNACDRGLI